MDWLYQPFTDEDTPSAAGSQTGRLLRRYGTKTKMISRQIFNVSTDTGTWTDSGPAFTGEIAQLRWETITADTGADLQIWLQQRTGDTGNGIVVINDNDCLGADFVRVPVQPTQHFDGFDTGTAQEAYVISGGEHLRVKVTPAGAACAGRLYVWTRD
jgi:hypothetical protein